MGGGGGGGGGGNSNNTPEDPPPAPEGTLEIDATATDVVLISDHVQQALDRRCQQFKFRSDEDDA